MSKKRDKRDKPAPAPQPINIRKVGRQIYRAVLKRRRFINPWR